MKEEVKKAMNYFIGITQMHGDENDKEKAFLISDYIEELEERKGTKKREIIDFIFYLVVILVVMIESGKQFKEYENYIKQLKQNNIEQTEEKEVYRNRCKMYEDILIEAGLLDECECR